MKNLLLSAFALLSFGLLSNAQCDPNFTHVNVDCNTLQFIPVSTGSQYTYSWDFGDGNFSTDASPTHSYLTDATYPVVLTISDTVAGCNNIITIPVTINCSGPCTLNPVITHVVDPLTCEVTFVSTVFGGTPPYNYLWNFGDGNTSTDPNPVHQYPNNSTWFACLTVSDAMGCTVDSTCMGVTVSCTQTSCDPTFTFNQIGCDSVQFFPVSMDSQYTYLWDFGDGNTSTDATPIHAFADGTWIVTLTVQDTIASCIDQTVLTIVIDCGFSPCTTNGAFAWNQDSTDCSIQFVSTAFGGTAPYDFFWQFGDGTTSTDPHPDHLYPTQGTWTPCLTITDANGCDTTFCDVVFTNCVTPSCDALFNYTHLSCNELYFIPVSMGANFTYLWDFGDGNTSTDQDPTHTFADGTYIVTLTVSDSLSGCSDTWVYTIQVACGTGCTVNGTFTYNQDNNCNFYFYSTAFGGQAPYTFYWNFGDGNTSTDQNPIHQYPNNSVWTPCLTITDANGCDTTVCYPVTSSCNPSSCDPNFTLNQIGCDSVQFFPVSTGSQYAYFWDFGDGNTSTNMNPIHTFADGVWIVTLVISDTIAGCNDQAILTITIDCGFMPCSTMGAISWNQDSTDCSIQFVSTAFGGTAPYTYYWQFGDGTTSTDPHPNHTYPTVGTWTPCLTITDANGCDTTICDVVFSNCITPSCDALFNFTHIGCNELYFIPVSSGANFSYFWDFGDGNTSTDPQPTHTFADGVYIVTLTVSDSLSGCSDTWLYTIQIDCGTNCTVNGVITYNPDFNNCNVYFASSAWGGQAPYTYLWNFGDGNTSMDQNPTHQYPNNSTWTPCLTITDANGCDTTICQVITVSCTGVNCDATFNQTYVDCDSVWFIPAVQDSTLTYLWDFGDGNTSNEISPIHHFGSNGTYTVVLYISDSLTGCNNAYTAIIDINCGANPCNVNAVTTWQPDSADCSIWMISSAWGGTAPYTYYWNFGDGNTSSDAHPVHTYPNSGTWTPCLTVTDANGCDTTVCMVVATNCFVGIEDYQTELEVTVFPNPSTGQYAIMAPNNASIMVYDLSGKLILQANNQNADGLFNIDISSAENGVYILHVNTDFGSSTQKLIKQ